MNPYSLAHLGDPDLLRGLAVAVRREGASTAVVLAHIAEVDARRLFAPAGYDSMFAYCLHVLRLSEDAAAKRIYAARAARAFPAIFEAVAEGRLHLSGVVTLARYLTPENAAELLATAGHKTRGQIQLLLAERFPQPDVPTRLEALPVPARQGELGSGPVAAPGGEHAPGHVGGPQHAPGHVDSPPSARMAPLSARRFALQMTVEERVHDKFQYAKALLGHAVPSGDLAEVFERVLDLALAELEKRKFAATTRPGPQRSSEDPRHIPAHVKREVWERDGGQCTFVSEAGQRCAARTRLEYDHVDPVARGGEATVEGIRLRCRAHNQYEAECVFGVDFMAAKREAARQAAESRKAAATARAAAVAEHRARAAEAKRAAAEERARIAAEGRARVAEAKRAAAEERARTAALKRAAEEERARMAALKRAAAEERARAEAEEKDPDRSVVPWLRRLGYGLEEAREAAAKCASMADAPMEQRIRAALRHLSPRGVSTARVA